ncbi:uncharacterized protein FOMMEDRAFT_143896 [Fomitiporia mediterranea MF3/22]|uniref:uncharacterized protein n=1 Tax=Fomitiporia mediterranea (strain MF3/22) TaxID=694068 RepID=UPI0004409943|nr:uncharacterized protein FOMMEDRAFT_143896 [Fomitiporia mediterranea MF3/22]EJD07526.1 hypothetical protein FOMMEDRAFT_143896 [Fomitiporia mediterranea MF3/22]
MDQDAFRKLLSTSKPGTLQSSSTAARGSLLPPKAKDDQKKPTESSKAAFKPRKIKKQSGLNYRDRAVERRTGAAGDFAEVESVLENFEKQHADYEDREAVEEQRRYLGGDAEHTVLVKGLDFALLEQTKSRMAASTSAQDDEELEEAFRGAISASPPPLDQTTTTSTSNTKKRTREDIVRELKNKRTKGEGDVNGAESSTPLADRALDEAKREGKFKPIGFKPIGATKDKEGKEVKKKKKRKVTENGTGDSQQRPPGSTVPSSSKDDASTSNTKQGPDKPASEPTPAPEPEPEPVNEDFDIFADAGEYEGVNFDDDDDEGIDDSSKREVQPSEARETIESTPAEGEPGPRRKWFDDDEPPSPPPERLLPSLNNQKGKSKDPSGSPEHTTPRGQRNENEEPHDDEEAERISRLAPLTSSAVPSIRDILAADTAREAEEKRKARKEKRKRGGGGDGGGGSGESKKVSAEAKLNRDYQKLKSYTEKKDKSS